MSELKKCPRCGGEAKYHLGGVWSKYKYTVSDKHYNIQYGGNGRIHIVECVTPGCMINALGETEKEAVAKWNTRPLESSLESQIASQAEDIRKLTEGIRNALDLARTGLAPDALGMTQEDWINHKLIRVSGELDYLMSTLKGDGE
jgi:hypothetical protein